MLKNWINNTVKIYLDHRYRRIEKYMADPYTIQEKWRKDMLAKGKMTVWGKTHGFRSIRNYEQWTSQVPIQTYDDLKPYIHQMMMGEQDILWPGKVKWYSKSSGTSSDRSKLIPVSNQNLRYCHVGGSWDGCAIHYHHCPDAKLFEYKSLVMGGSIEPYKHNRKSWIGDVSAIMTKNMPWIGKVFYTPDFDIALLSDWEEKIEKMAAQVIHENVYMFGGVPTWTLLLFDKMLELTGAEYITDIWPEVRLYMHGGVGFTPYREQFKEYIPRDDFIYQEIYNASEGFLGIQQDYGADDMLLLLDNGIFYEFVPRSEWHKDTPSTTPIEDLVIGDIYSLVITTNAGLWRYDLGDTVEITSKQPLKVKISGRVSQYINVFGEEVMIHNTDQALATACHELAASANEYSVAPIFIESNSQGAHEWIIEFETEPTDLRIFEQRLDRHLQRINSDYCAKRYKDLALRNLTVRSVPKGTFIRWMQRRGKLGGQNKVPRLSNDRKYVESILELVDKQ